jgi:hypothetical protein
MHVETNLVDEDLCDVAMIESKKWHVISNMLNEIQNQFLIDGRCENAIYRIMEYQGSKIYKSMLVIQLNANIFLSKDRLTHVRKSIYSNNSNVYFTTTSSSNTCLLSLGNNCGVYFVQDDNNQDGSKWWGGKKLKARIPTRIVMAQVMEHGG